MTEPSDLAQRIAREIAAAIAEGDIADGAHLPAQAIADRYGVSRSPVRAALALLVAWGHAESRSNRGHFARPAGSGAPAPTPETGEPFEPPSPYQRIADDWLADRIPEDVTEQFLRARYDVTKAQLSEILLRAAREGWAARKPGYGWRLLAVAKTPAAFEQIYRFRMLIEPAAMLEPGYRIDRDVLARLKQVQQRMLDGDPRLDGERLLDAGASFHEALIGFAGNPFFHQSLVQVNRMRRLLEYRARFDRRRLDTQCRQHLAIVDLLERGDVGAASALMRRHLAGALVQKTGGAVRAGGVAREGEQAGSGDD